MELILSGGLSQGPILPSRRPPPPPPPSLTAGAQPGANLSPSGPLATSVPQISLSESRVAGGRRRRGRQEHSIRTLAGLSQSLHPAWPINLCERAAGPISAGRERGTGNGNKQPFTGVTMFAQIRTWSGERGAGSGEQNAARKGLAQKLPPRSPCQRELSGTRPPLRFSKLIWLSPGTWATKVLLRCAFPAPKTDTPFHRRRFPITSTLFISHLPAPEILAPVRRTCFSASGHASMCWP